MKLPGGVILSDIAKILHGHEQMQTVTDTNVIKAERSG